MNFKSAAVVYLDDRMNSIERQVKDEALFIAKARKQALVTREIMVEAFQNVMRRFSK